MAANQIDIPNINITVTSSNLEDDLYRVCNQLFKDVNRDEIKFEELQGGYVNSIVLLKFKNKSLIFRTFNLKFSSVKIAEEFNKTFDQLETDENQNSDFKIAERPKDFSDVIFSRATEYQVMHELSKHNLCQKVYGRYNNGIIYGYSNGIVSNGPLMLNHNFMNECAKKLARFHSIKYDNTSIQSKTHFERMFVQLDPQFKVLMNDMDKKFEKVDEYPYDELPKSRHLFELEEKYFYYLNKLGFGRIGFCHNDCNQRNIIWDSKTKTIEFIDFEMTMNNYIAFEFGYLFGCYPGHFLNSFDANCFPNDEYRRKFLRKYLEEFNQLNNIKLSPEKFEDELEILFIRVNLTTLLFFSRLIMNAMKIDERPETFKNDDFDKARKGTKWYCGKFAIKVWYLLNKINQPFLKSAQQYLERQKN